MSSMVFHLERTIRLVRRFHEDWCVEEIAPDSPTTLKAKELADTAGERPLIVIAPMLRAGVLRMTASMPLEKLATRTGGLGRPDPGLPLGFWPVHLSVAMGFRLRNLGWPIEFHWPSTVLLEGKSVAIVHCEVIAGRIYADAALSLEVDESAPAEQSLVIPFRTSLSREKTDDQGNLSVHALMPTFVHGFMQMLESPFPRHLSLDFYNRHCHQLGHVIQQDMDGGRLVKGIARRVADDGSLMVEIGEGEFTSIPCQISSHGAC